MSYLVGLSFGSATSGDGFDVSSTVESIVSNLQTVETPWKTQLTKLQQQDAVLSTLGTDLSTMLTSLQTLSDFTGVFAAKYGSSSNSDVLELTSASTSATAGTHNVVVSALAQAQSDASNYLSSSSDSLSGSLTIGSTVITLGVSGSTDTLSNLVSTINSDDLGVTASVLTGTSGVKLSLVSDTTGSSGAFYVSGSFTDTTSGTSVSITQGQAAQDAQFTIDGVSLTSASNSVTDAIPGVTFQLLGTSTSPLQVVITNSSDGIESAVEAFVTNYNTVISALTAQEGNDASGNAEPLYGSSIVAQLQQQLESAMISTFGSGTVNSLYSLGISMNDDGTMSVDTDTLASVINTNLSDVVSFFQDANSFGSTLGTKLNNLGDVYTTGLITLQREEISSQESTIEDKIANQEALISKQKDVLTTELEEANEILQEIPTQLDYINKIYSASTGYNTNS